MRFLLTPLLALFTFCVFAQPTNILIGKSKSLRRGICEPSIVINKQNPKNIVAAAILDKVFYSFDGGETWKEDTLKSTFGVWGDPVLISDYQGNIYFFHLSDPTGKNWSSEEILDRIVCQKSADGGQTFNNGGYMGLAHPKDQDKQWATADEAGNLYATWTQFDKYGSKDTVDKSNILFAKSSDGGLNWSEAKQINQFSGGCLDDDNTTEGAVPAVDSAGNIYVAWAYNNAIYFDKSTDGGNTWLAEDKLISKQIGGWDIEIPGLQRANGMPVTVVNKSKTVYENEVYVCWVDKREGNYDVWFSKSVNQGETWSIPSRINDDETNKDQFFAALVVDESTGYLYSVFYDRRNHDSTQTDVYLATSMDGGATWENEKISEKPFTPNPNVFFGDYNDIDAVNGVLRPIWTRYDEGGEMSIWTTIIERKN